MGVSIIGVPQRFVPVYNEIIFTLDSDEKDQINFKYILDIYIDGVTDPVRIKLLPNVDNGYGVFKINRILENYVGSELFNGLVGIDEATENMIEYQVWIGQEYGAPITEYMGEGITFAYWAWNGVVQDLENFDYRDYYPADYAAVVDPSSWKFPSKTLSNRSSDRLIELGSEDWIYWFNDADNMSNDTIYSPQAGNGLTKYVSIVTYDENDNLINDSVLEYTYPSPNVNRILVFGSGPHNLNGLRATDFYSQTFTQSIIITKEVSKYVVSIINPDLELIYEPVTYYLRDVVSNRYHREPRRVVYQGHLGGYEGYTFNLSEESSLNITRAQWNKLDNSSSFENLTTNRVNNERRKELGNKAKKSNSVRSEFLRETDHDLMEEIVTSANVYESEVNKMYCVTAYTSGTMSDKYYINGDFPIEKIDFNTGTSSYFISDIGSSQSVCLMTKTSYNDVYLSTTTTSYFTQSTGILWVDKDLIYKPINILDSRFQYNKPSDKNINFTLNYQYSVDKKLQRN